VAEGVEREDTRRALRELGCDRYQGFLMSKALPPEDLELWLSARLAPKTIHLTTAAA
jgi:EAL domain-containing protein (putative c-di-GMP-specific phosphodiesterase class I)